MRNTEKLAGMVPELIFATIGGCMAFEDANENWEVLAVKETKNAVRLELYYKNEPMPECGLLADVWEHVEQLAWYHNMIVSWDGFCPEPDGSIIRYHAPSLDYSIKKRFGYPKKETHRGDP